MWLPVGEGGLAEMKQHQWYDGFDWQALQDGTLQPPEELVPAGILDADADTRRYDPPDSTGNDSRGLVQPGLDDVFAEF
eukprot:SAG31_NODE_1219_length_9302_cov_13.527328_4_plen_79_part_00